MSFSITNEKEEDLELIQITDLMSGIQVRILPGIGALLHEYSIPTGNRRIQVINGYTSLTDLKRNLAISFKSAKLSPFVCRLAEGKYEYAGKNREFKNKFSDGNAIHGILFNKPFTVEKKNIQTDEASVLLSYKYVKDDPAYPYEYSIDIKYTLRKNGRLWLDTVVKNNTAESIPMADGWHPYFSLEGDVNNWLLSFRSRKNVVFNEKLIPLGHTIETSAFFEPAYIGDRFFDHCYQLEPSDAGIAAAVLENPDNGLRLSLFPDKSYPYLQIYTPDDRKSIALENLSAAPDSFNNKMGLIHLNPGESQTFTVLYQLEFV